MTYRMKNRLHFSKRGSSGTLAAGPHGLRVSPIGFRSVVIAAIAGTCFTAALRAGVAETTFASLAAESDLVVLAKVSKVEDGPGDLKADEGMPALRIATAEVIETWKGDPVREVRYVASPLWVCDTSSAKTGERVVLFLVRGIAFMRRKAPRFLSIAHYGRGRIRLREVGDATQAMIDRGIILPEGTRVIPQKRRTLTFRELAAARAALNSGKSVELPFDGELIELKALRELVGASHQQRAAKRG